MNLPHDARPHSLIHTSSTDTELVRAVDVGRIVRCLIHYPYFCVIRCPSKSDDIDTLPRLAKMVAHFGTDSFKDSRSGKCAPLARVSVTSDPANTLDIASRLSQTHLPLVPHTDSTHMKAPHELVAFQCVKADPVGGETIILPIDDVLRELGETEAGLLRECTYPFGDERRAILSGPPHDPLVRFFDAELLQSGKTGDHILPFRHRWALKALDTVLKDASLGHKFRLGQGDILFVNNVKALHGRSGFAKDSGRLLYRIRMRAPSLRLPPLQAESPPSRSDSDLQAPDPEWNGSLEEIDHKLIELLIENDRLDDALLLCSTHLAKAPRDLAARMLLGRLYEDADRLDDAIGQYALVCETDPSYQRVLQRLGDLLLATGRFQDAKNAYRQFLLIEPNDLETGFSLSSLSDREGDLDEAQVLLEQTLLAHPFVLRPCLTPDRPTLLIAKGYRGARFRVMRNDAGRYERRSDGGDHDVSRLLQDSEYNFVDAHIVADDLDGYADPPDFDLILNATTHADSEADSLLTLARFADRFPAIPVINHPRALLDISRNRLYQRLAGAEGVTYPRTERMVWARDRFVQILKTFYGQGFEWPVLVRPVASRERRWICENEDQLSAYFEQQPTDSAHFISQFRHPAHRSGAYNRLRMVFIDGHFYPIASVFDVDQLGDERVRPSLIEQNPWMQNEERAYLEDPYAFMGRYAFGGLMAMKNIVKLDCFVIDFALSSEGQGIHLLDLNADMNRVPRPEDAFPYVRPHIENIRIAFKSMLKQRLAE